MTDYTLIERLKLRNENGSLGEITEGDQLQAAEAIEALQGENERLAHANNALKLAVSGLQAKLDAMGKGEPVGWFIDVTVHGKSVGDFQLAARDYWGDYSVCQPLYAAPKALAPSREVIGRYMADKGFYLSKEALDGLMLKLEGIGGTP